MSHLLQRIGAVNARHLRLLVGPCARHAHGYSSQSSEEKSEKEKGKERGYMSMFCVYIFQSKSQTLMLWNCDVCIHACTNVQIQVCIFVRVCCACLCVRVRVMISMREREKVCVFLWYLMYRKEPHNCFISACVCPIKAN